MSYTTKNTTACQTALGISLLSAARVNTVRRSGRLLFFAPLCCHGRQRHAHFGPRGVIDIHRGTEP